MKRLLALASAAATLAAAGCGDHVNGTVDATTGAPSAQAPLVVSAAASLKTAFTEYAEGFGAADAKLSFAGSDVLAAQIEQGATPDLFAAANTKLPDALYAKGLVEHPTVFAANRLVLAVPSGSAIDSVDDVAAAGVDLAIGSESVPVGAYTRTVVGRLPGAESAAVLRNVRSEEPDVKGIVGKLTQGAVDAGFVYATDVAATKGELKAVELPRQLQPSAAYGIAVVKGGKNPAAAKAFIAGLLSGDGQAALEQAGFEPPPAR